MRILWFTNTPSLYKSQKRGYNGGGWISSLEKHLSSDSQIKLAVSFFHTDIKFKDDSGVVTYYPISLYNGMLKKIQHKLFYSKFDNIELNEYNKIINDFNPDLIHVFGLERSFGLITKITKIPVVIHLQGILAPCQNAYYPPGISRRDYLFSKLRPRSIVKKILEQNDFRYRANREIRISKNCLYFMGRTDWDKRVSRLYAPNSNYFYCGEVLRETFYESQLWKPKQENKITILSTISSPLYKGMDLIIKTALLLRQLYPDKMVEWNVFGIKECKFQERFTKIKCKDVGVKLRGFVDEKTLANNMLQSDCFIHPSYIDNSPNSVCEAQIIGVPVIATYVGGVPSIVEDNKTGLLVSSNDPYSLAAKIIELKSDTSLQMRLSLNEHKIASERHNKKDIIESVLNIYNQICKKEN